MKKIAGLCLLLVLSAVLMAFALIGAITTVKDYQQAKHRAKEKPTPTDIQPDPDREPIPTKLTLHDPGRGVCFYL